MLRPLRHLPTPHLPRLRCSPFVQRSPSSQYITISPQCSPFSSSTPVSTSSINRSPDSLIRVLNYPTNPPPPLITSYLSHSRPTYPSLTVPPPPPPYPNDLSSPDGCLSHSAILPDLQSELDRLLHLTYSLAYYSLPYMPPLPAVPTKHAPMLAQANLNLSHAALSNITHHLTESRVRNIDSWAAHYHKIKTDFVKSKKKASKDPKKVTAKSLNSTQRSRLNALYHPPPIAPRIPESPDGVIAVDGIRCNVMASLLECCLYNQVGRVQGNSGGRAATAASKAATDSAAGTPPPPPAPASPSPLTPKEVITQSAIVIRSTTRQLDRNRYILSSLSQSLNQLSALLSYYFNITLNFVPNGINGSNVQVARTTLEGGGWSERGITEYAWPVFFGTTPSMYLGTPYANKSDYEYSKILDRHALGTYFNTLLRGQVVTMLVYGEAARRTDELVKTAVRERDVLVATDEANHECLDDKGLQEDMNQFQHRRPATLLPSNLYAVLCSCAEIARTTLMVEGSEGPLSWRGEVVGEMLRGIGAAGACGWNESGARAFKGHSKEGVLEYGDDDVDVRGGVFELSRGRVVGAIVDVLVNGTRWREFEHAEGLPAGEVELREAVEFTFLRSDDVRNLDMVSHVETTDLEIMGISDLLVNGGTKGDYGTLPGAVIEALLDSKYPAEGVSYFDSVYSINVKAAPVCCQEAAISCCAMASYQNSLDGAAEPESFKDKAMSLYQAMYSPTPRAVNGVVRTLEVEGDWQACVDVITSSCFNGGSTAQELLDKEYLKTKMLAVGSALAACNAAGEYEKGLAMAHSCCPENTAEWEGLVSDDFVLSNYLGALRRAGRAMEAVSVFRRAENGREGVIPTNRNADFSKWIEATNEMLAAMAEAAAADPEDPAGGVYKEAMQLVESRETELLTAATFVNLMKCARGKEIMEVFVMAERAKLVSDELRANVMLVAGRQKGGAGWDRIVRMAMETSNVAKNKAKHEYVGITWIDYFEPVDGQSLDALLKAFYMQNRDDMSARLISSCAREHAEMLTPQSFVLALDTTGRSFRKARCRGKPVEEYWEEKQGTDDQYYMMLDAMVRASKEVVTLYRLAGEVGFGEDEVIITAAARALRSLRKEQELGKLIAGAMESGMVPAVGIFVHGILACRENNNPELEKDIMRRLKECGYDFEERGGLYGKEANNNK